LAVTEPAKSASFESLVEKISDICQKLLQTLEILRDNIDILETGQGNLLLEIENKRNASESRVNSLETEVSKLRLEIQSLKEILDIDEKQRQI
jgi:glutathione synthase/RimK-type ligase-like ATP-grasp enzyme